MKGSHIKKQLLSNGYKIDDVSRLIGLDSSELHSVLESEDVPKHIVEKINKAIGKNILLIKEDVTPTNVIEGNNNMLGDNNNTNNNLTIIKLIELLEKKEQQIDRILSLLERKDHQIDRLFGIVGDDKSKTNKR